MDKKPINITEFSKSLDDNVVTEADYLVEQEYPSLTWKEARALQKSNYYKVKDKYNTAYILQNKKTLQVAEIQATSSFHACTMIGWKPHKTKVIDVISVKERQEIIDEFGNKE